MVSVDVKQHVYLQIPVFVVVVGVVVFGGVFLLLFIIWYDMF